MSEFSPRKCGVRDGLKGLADPVEGAELVSRNGLVEVVAPSSKSGPRRRTIRRLDGFQRHGHKIAMNSFGERKDQFVVRCHEQGNWKRFCSDRASVSNRGVDLSVAWRLVSEMYPPDGSCSGKVSDEVVREHANAERARLAAMADSTSWADVLAECAAGRKTSKADMVDWVMDHIRVPWDAVDPGSVPSPGAVALLDYAKRDDGSFFKEHLRPLLMKEVTGSKPKFAGSAHASTKADIHRLLKDAHGG